MLENYQRSLANTLVEEGGYANHPNDPGGPTMRGVIQRTYDDYRDRKILARQSVRAIDESELKDIYWSGYAKPIRFSEWPKGPDQIAFDIAVNSGPSRAWSIAGAVLGQAAQADIVAAAAAADDKAALVKKLCARRASFYRGLKTFETFGKGWMRRNARMEALGVKMALEAAGTPQAEVTKQLDKEQSKAGDASNKAGKGAAGTGTVTTGGGAGSTQVDAASWDWSAIVTVGLVILALAGLTAFLIFLWRRHGERAKAYAMASRGDLEASLAGIMTKLGAAGS
jgi:lysozyme family protein